MDWAALQRALLALSSEALCSSVLSAREQQSLPTWFGALMGRSDSANGPL